jgi:hypothetical protein
MANTQSQGHFDEIRYETDLRLQIVR